MRALHGMAFLLPSRYISATRMVLHLFAAQSPYQFGHRQLAVRAALHRIGESGLFLYKAAERHDVYIGFFPSLWTVRLCTMTSHHHMAVAFPVLGRSYSIWVYVLAHHLCAAIEACASDSSEVLSEHYRISHRAYRDGISSFSRK